MGRYLRPTTHAYNSKQNQSGAAAVLRPRHKDGRPSTTAPHERVDELCVDTLRGSTARKVGSKRQTVSRSNKYSASAAVGRGRPAKGAARKRKWPGTQTTVDSRRDSFHWSCSQVGAPRGKGSGGVGCTRFQKYFSLCFFIFWCSVPS